MSNKHIIEDAKVAKKLLETFLRENGATCEQMNAAYADAAKNMFYGLNEHCTGTKAKEIMAEIPIVADIIKFLPKGEQGRPAEPIQQRKDAAFLGMFHSLMAKGKSAKETARIIHEEYGIGTSNENVRRKFYTLRKKSNTTKRR